MGALVALVYSDLLDDPDSTDEFGVTASALLQADHPHHLAHQYWEVEYSADPDGYHLAYRC